MFMHSLVNDTDNSQSVIELPSLHFGHKGKIIEDWHLASVSCKN